MSFNPGDIVLVDLGTIPSGHEQAGVRPGIVISEEGGVVLLIPLSATAARLKFSGTVLLTPGTANRLSKPSVALVFQLRAVDSRRLLHQIGTLSAKEKRSVNKALRAVALIK